MAKEIISLQQKYATLAIENWLSGAVLTWNWWVLVFMFIFPWLIFLKYLDRERSLQIWCFGLIVILITSFTDDLGSELSVWIYPIKFAPFGLLALPFDFSMIPVAYMLIYQYFKSWKTFCIALVSQATIFAFVGEPFSVWLGFVTYLKWEYIYSFVFYIVTGLAARFFIQKLTPY
ncbi:CBO0543 family protein [Bacillus sp. MRMR6]|uniref:CBO0543 family protein n=1 Tax=Bacillus sp. MRMR6 TaxID=1928617 RepID=UPI0026DDBD44|nr:CBO0543 family protein [Bacillus sp. MRMR6]